MSTYAQGGLIMSPDGVDSLKLRAEVGERVIQASTGEVKELQAVEGGGYIWVRVSTDEQEQAWRDQIAGTLSKLNAQRGSR